jgi:DNA-binding NtrC family response regulator
MKKALVIDDDELDLELIGIVLSKEGFTIISTADGPQGVTLYKHHQPDLVFLDLGLPSMSGIAVLQEIRAYDKNALVFLITGHGSVDSAKAAMGFGAAAFLEKTTNVETMVNKIKSALQRTGLARIS